jgi:hypothetical protein
VSHNPEDTNVNSHCHKNLKPHELKVLGNEMLKKIFGPKDEMNNSGYYIMRNFVICKGQLLSSGK